MTTTQQTKNRYCKHSNESVFLAMNYAAAIERARGFNCSCGRQVSLTHIRADLRTSQVNGRIPRHYRWSELSNTPEVNEQ